MNAPNSSRISAIWAELRKRKVFQVAIVYVLMAWGVMQVGELLFEALQIPDVSYSLLVILVLLGFPVAVVLAWAYEITPEGVRRDIVKELQDTESREPLIAKKAKSRSRCIAIMPFRDMTHDHDLAYFCEGLAEEIQHALCRIDRLEVVARAHSVPFGGKKINIEEIARKLSAGSVLEGSVRKSNGSFRITVQLVCTSSGTDIWSKSFDTAGEDEFQVQRNIAADIADSIRLTFRSGKRLQHFKCDPLTYDYYRRGMRFFRRRTAQDIIFARRMFEKAVETDRDFGPARAGLAYAAGFEFLHFNHCETIRQRGREAAESALVLAPDLAATFVARGFVHLMDKRSCEANEAFETAATIDPRNFEAHYFNALNWSNTGDHDKAAEYYRKASSLREKDFQSVYELSQALFANEEHIAGKEALENSLQLIRSRLDYRPDDYRALNIGALALLQTSQKDQARCWMRESLDNAPLDAVLEYHAACFYSMAGDTGRSMGHLRKCSVLGELDLERVNADSRLEDVRQCPGFLARFQGEPPFSAAIPAASSLSAIDLH